MARWRIRHQEPEPMSAGRIALLAAGVIAGLAAGAYVAHRLGGVSGISARVRKRWPAGRARGTAEDDDRTDTGDGPHASHDVAHAYAADHAATYESDVDDDADDIDDVDDAGYDAEFEDEESGEADDDGYGDEEDEEEIAAGEEESEDEFASADPELEDRVLEAFVNDPVLAECPVDIGAIRRGTIELTGGVQTREEYEHATTLAGGVPGVETVVNRLDILEEETEEADAVAHYEAGDPRYAESGWDGETIGTGRRRQGTSDDVDRHEDPKVPLETRATSEDSALRDAAGEIDDIAERRRRHGRTGAANAHGAGDAEPHPDSPGT